MNLNRVGIIYRKELIDALRDRRTIISTIVLPILMFPVLTISFGFLAARSMQKVEREGSTIMLLGETNAPSLAERLRASDGIRVVPSTGAYVVLISDKKLRCALEFPPHFEEEVKANRHPGVKIYHFASEMRSQVAVRAVQKILRDYRDQIIETRLMESGLTKDLLQPFLAAREIAKKSQVPFDISVSGVAAMLLMMLPLAVMFAAVLMTIALWSKTTKEAHSYASPLMLLVLMPAMAAIVPGFDLNAKFALVPVLNVSLVSREVLSGNYSWFLITAVFGSSCG